MSDRQYAENRTGNRMWAVGGLVFAAILMILLGLWSVIAGVAAIAGDAVFTRQGDYSFAADLTGWGWVHLVLGAVAVLAGFALLTGAIWARLVGVLLAVLVAINYFLFLPFFPIWSIIVIALAVFVIWSLTTAPGPDRGATWSAR